MEYDEGFFTPPRKIFTDIKKNLRGTVKSSTRIRKVLAKKTNVQVIQVFFWTAWVYSWKNVSYKIVARIQERISMIIHEFKSQKINIH